VPTVFRVARGGHTVAVSGRLADEAGTRFEPGTAGACETTGGGRYRRRVRILGAVAVVVGAFVLGLDAATVDRVIATLPGPGRHGIHVSDVVGSGVLLVGIVLLWRAPARA
jgi:hypothetical protein